MSDFQSYHSATRQPESIEQLASAISELMAHLYINTWNELSKLPSEPAGEQLLDKLFGAVADLDEIAKHSRSDDVRQFLGDVPPRFVH